MEVFSEAFGEKKRVFFDEIQNVAGWELFASRLLRQGFQVFITGSNANLISRELGTHLTGRHVDLELYPFSFAEFLDAGGVKVPKKIYTTVQKAALSKKFKEYLFEGGMPEAVVFQNKAILPSLLNDIIQKDILARHSVRKPAELKAVLKFLIANAANHFSFRSLENNFGVKSSNTAQKYVEYAEEAYLLFTVKRFELKLKRLEKNPKKIYCIDNGIVAATAPSMLEKKGAMLENAVAIHLKRLGADFYYYKGETGREADFIIPSQNEVIQVCLELNDGSAGREIEGLLEAAPAVGAKKALILTLEQEAEFTRSGVKIIAMPAWQWMIESEQGTI